MMGHLFQLRTRGWVISKQKTTLWWAASRVFCYWTVVASGSGLYTCNNEKPLKLQVKIKKNAIK